MAPTPAEKAELREKAYREALQTVKAYEDRDKPPSPTSTVNI